MLAWLPLLRYLPSTSGTTLSRSFSFVRAGQVIRTRPASSAACHRSGHITLPSVCPTIHPSIDRCLSTHALSLLVALPDGPATPKWRPSRRSICEQWVAANLLTTIECGLTVKREPSEQNDKLNTMPFAYRGLTDG
ncbi:hypothetical protein PHET_01660 [Paragonimus heterotremus]|uniref:Uncharacterized protein n=1 Tax=Paragonimus heterotremus TaxID=100268 RepID=A0A8J4THD6_9TREM|nr:hypothetical protein PHET_01660 [Paragonimus heterotremus]